MCTEYCIGDGRHFLPIISQILGIGVLYLLILWHTALNVGLKYIPYVCSLRSVLNSMGTFSVPRKSPAVFHFPSFGLRTKWCSNGKPPQECVYPVPGTGFPLPRVQPSTPTSRQD
jgi:hypothetical protein